MAQISMDRAIQIATSQRPGKVLESTLVGERWENGDDAVAKPALVLYHVVILSSDEPKAIVNHVWVNAIDGTIWRTEKEELKAQNFEYREREQEPIEGGILNGRAIRRPNAVYPAIARAAHAEGKVEVQVVIDEDGNVIAAKAISGHPLLQAAAVSAAREAKFTPTFLSGEPVKVSGVLVYNFVAK